MSFPAVPALEYVHRLESAGFSRQQAETCVHLLMDFMDERIATRQALREVEQRLLARFGAMLAAGLGLVASLFAFSG